MTDKELVYLFRTENLHNAKLILLNKYYDKILNSMNFKFRKNIEAFEIDEFNGMIYMNIIKAIQKFDYHRKGSNFYYCAKKIIVNNVLEDIRRAKNYKNCVLTNALSFEHNKTINFITNDVCNNNEDNFYNTIDGEKIYQTIDDENTIQNTIHLLSKNDFTLKKIIDLKSKGYQTNQIASVLKIPKKTVSTLFSKFILLVRKKINNL